MSCLPTCPFGKLKLNTAAVSYKFARKIGVGATICDYKGNVLATSLTCLTSSYSVEVSQLLALREGLKLAKLLNQPVSFTKCSSPFAIAFLNCPVPNLEDSHFIVLDIKTLFSDVGICNCQASSIKGKSLANMLALKAFSYGKECLWVFNSPAYCPSAL
ncbi:hypothetical protein QYF36_005303 [Acer negundo]|nr:hypothetical protein QYF36_005303 [Acer negundo]